MQIIRLETIIAAPAERCFFLSLSIDLHKASTKQTAERAIAGVTKGLIGPGETVTWRGRHFGFWLKQKTRITQYLKPDWFQDTMEEGLFKSFVHDHAFVELGPGQTLMKDELRFAAPLGLLGRIAERFVLRRYLTTFLSERNNTIKRIAEGDETVWSAYTR